MKTKSAVSVIVAAASLCGASAVFAQNVQRPWYVEGSVGWSNHGMDGSDINRVFGSRGVTSSSSFDNTDTAWGLTLGYRITPNWGIEGSYNDFGKFKYSGTISRPIPGAVGGDYKANAWSLAGVGTIPLDKAFSLYGRLGLAYSEAKLSASSTGSAVSGAKNHDTGWMLGLGAKYDFTPAVYARLGWDRYFRVGDDQSTGRGDIDVVGAGVGFRF
jgi:OOP family OmpA-OmpF porin